MNFVRDMLNREYSLKDASTKYGIPEEDLLDEFLKQKKQYTKAEIDQIMKEVYYA